MASRRPNRGYVERDEQGNVTIHAPAARIGGRTSPERIEVYLDTSLVSGLAERDLRPVELTALVKILEAHKSGRVAVVTSHVTKTELGRMSEEKRAPHEYIYLLLENLPEAVESQTDSGLTMTGVGGVREDELFTELKALVPDINDARHLFQAIKNGADYFVTDDQRTIVSRASGIEARYSIKVRLPSQLVAELAL